MRLKVRNTIKYQFSRPVSYGLQRLRLWPRKGSGQSSINWKIDYFGAKEQVNYKDHHNNLCTLITFIPQSTEIVIRVRGSVKTNQTKKKPVIYSEPCPVWIYEKQTAFTTAGKSILNFCRFWSDSSLFLKK